MAKSKRKRVPKPYLLADFPGLIISRHVNRSATGLPRPRARQQARNILLLRKRVADLR